MNMRDHALEHDLAGSVSNGSEYVSKFECWKDEPVLLSQILARLASGKFLSTGTTDPRSKYKRSAGVKNDLVSYLEGYTLPGNPLPKS